MSTSGNTVIPMEALASGSVPKRKPGDRRDGSPVLAPTVSRARTCPNCGRRRPLFEAGLKRNRRMSDARPYNVRRRTGSPVRSSHVRRTEQPAAAVSSILSLPSGRSGRTERARRRAAAWEEDVPSEELSSQQRKRVYVSLYQTHVPSLEAIGVVEYDADEGIVELADRAEAVDEHLGGRRGRERP